ncbi:MarR family transcriptional regulator [Companilactobacillus jidongensis]|uniref:MarR family transcriptional regulator n=1 Tax=Companilactobacillus jidongensis TaxID=2486006 RepID=UPI000F77A981|nr:MarR family transcriptional regulator [Companilactobacillus jidongensis]
MENIIELLNQFLIKDSKGDKEKQWAADQINDEGLKQAINTFESREFRLIGLFKNTDTILLKTLPQKLKVSQASSSRSASKLQKAGLIEKTKSEDNQKEWILRLTDDGHTILSIKKRLDQKNLKELKDRTRNFSDEDVLRLSELLEIIVEHS